MYGWIRVKGLSGRSMRLILLVTVAVFALCGSASATPLSFSFDHGNEGWLQTQNNGNTMTSAGFQPNNGNPGGRLSARDTGQETGCPNPTPTAPCDLLFFYSPVIPTLGGNYGGTGSFDLRSSLEPEFGAELLLLPPPPNYLDGLIPEDLGTNFNHLSISLTETANWNVCPYDGGSCSPPSQAEFKALIGATDRVAVMADVARNGTGETYDLDNVILTDGPPAMPAPVTTTPHKKKCKKKKRHGRAAKTSKKCKKKKHRRAAIVKLRG
jgi:hypothetical protein